MGDGKSDVLQGTLDLMVLKTLESMGSLHGYALARRIEQVSDHTVIMNQGTIYPALLRLQQRKWIKAEWGISETGRRAKVLFADQTWPAKDRNRNRELGAGCHDNGTLSGPIQLRSAQWIGYGFC